MGDMGDIFSYCSRGVMSVQSDLSQNNSGLSSSEMPAIEWLGSVVSRIIG